MKIALRWEETWDDNDNSIWEAPAPYTDENGAPECYWRLKQRLFANRIEWFEAHDGELIPGQDAKSWPTLAKAKAAVLKDHKDIILDASKR